MLYADLVLGFIRVILYLTFMTLMIKIHTFPLFAIRPIYLSLRSFKKSLNDVVMSRRAIQNLNIMYPDVTPEQLRSYSDTICIICREEMAVPEGEPTQQIKKLPCDHIFHKSCLRSWFQRQQTCPTCRTSILRFNNANQAHQPQQPQPQPQPQPQQPEHHYHHQHQPNIIPPSPSPSQSTPIHSQTPRTGNHQFEFGENRFLFNFNQAQTTIGNISSFGFLPPFG
jgi:E3 ubiquitin-protein ligase synoviolin